jgi:hypothetical protein
MLSGTSVPALARCVCCTSAGAGTNVWHARPCTLHPAFIAAVWSVLPCALPGMARAVPNAPGAQSRPSQVHVTRLVGCCIVPLCAVQSCALALVQWPAPLPAISHQRYVSSSSSIDLAAASMPMHAASCGHTGPVAKSRLATAASDHYTNTIAKDTTSLVSLIISYSHCMPCSAAIMMFYDVLSSAIICYHLLSSATICYHLISSDII